MQYAPTNRVILWLRSEQARLLACVLLLVLASCSPLAEEPSPVPGATVRPTVTPSLLPNTPSSQNSPPATPMPVAVLQLPNVADTVERARPAVVSVLSEVIVRDFFGNPRSTFGNGSGVIFDPQGLVLTNNHVIQDANKVTVTLDNGSQVGADIVGGDRLSDLAVLRIPRDNHPFVPPGKDVPLRVGEWVIAIGNALALPGGPTVTVGVISALGRSIDESPDVALYDLIQTDTAINPGNSGGPLLNLRGELIGINTVVLRGAPIGEAPIEGIGFAINMETAGFVSEQLVRLGRVQWPWMGLSLADLTPETAAGVGLPVREGVVVRAVSRDGPSDKAGIRPGDVILSLNGKKVATVSDLTRTLRQNFRVGQEIEVVVFRSGSPQSVRVVLSERPR